MTEIIKQLRFFLLFTLMVLLNLIFSVPSDAFHNGGVGYCEGCHALHKSSENRFDASDQNPYLLMSSDPGSVCLTCHMQAGEMVPANYHVATAESDMPNGSPPVQLTPGGDFGWLKKRYQWSSGNGDGENQSPGERHGHNITASDYGFSADLSLIEAPGGTYPAARLSCISCHDPHGRYRRFADGTIGTTDLPVQNSGSYETSPDPTPQAAVGVYRLLGGKGYSTASAKNESFVSDPPAAVSPADFNRAETDTDTRVAYGSGMSEWCTNCHKTLGASNSNTSGHPAGNTVKLEASLVANYNAYIASGNSSGSFSTSYTSMVPFEMGTSDYILMKRTARSDGSMTAGPDTVSNMMCLTCHRAHASGWDKAARWNMKTDFLVFNGDFPGVDRTDVPVKYSQGRMKSEIKRAFYERPASKYASYQRSLCNKCHTKD